MERQPPDPVDRIHRLIRAIGDGPHAFTFRRWDHLRRILTVLEDDRALRLVSPPPSRTSGAARQGTVRQGSARRGET